MSRDQQNNQTVPVPSRAAADHQEATVVNSMSVAAPDITGASSEEAGPSPSSAPPTDAISPFTLQRQKDEGQSTPAKAPFQFKPNNTGLPDSLKSGVEHLSGYSLDDVNVHYNSSKPASLQAHAYAQGTDIHVAPGQEQHLPHEAWHVVQQKQGRVQPTLQLKAGVAVNDDQGLEREADIMGARAINVAQSTPVQTKTNDCTITSGTMPVQRFIGFEFQMLQSNVTLGDEEGGTQKWAPIQDGRNLELQTTTTLKTAEEVSQVATEMAALGAKVAAAQPNDVVTAGNYEITVKRSDDSAQPQVNFDLHARDFSGAFAGHLTSLQEKEYFDAKVPRFNWHKKATNKQISAIRDVIAASKQLIPDAHIIGSIYDGHPPSHLTLPPTLYDDIRAVILIKFSQWFQDTTKTAEGLLKDVPLLVKTSLTELMASVSENVTAADASIFDTDKVEEKVVKFIDTEVKKLLASQNVKKPRINQTQRETAATGGSLYEKTHRPAKKEIDAETLTGILVELRRAKVIPYHEWVDFAMNAFTEVGTLFDPDEQQAEENSGSSSEEEEEEDDNGSASESEEQEEDVSEYS